MGAVGEQQGECRGFAWWTGVSRRGASLGVFQKTRKVQRGSFSDGAVTRGRT